MSDDDELSSDGDLFSMTPTWTPRKPPTLFSTCPLQTDSGVSPLAAGSPVAQTPPTKRQCEQELKTPTTRQCDQELDDSVLNMDRNKFKAEQVGCSHYELTLK